MTSKILRPSSKIIINRPDTVHDEEGNEARTTVDQGHDERQDLRHALTLLCEYLRSIEDDHVDARELLNGRYGYPSPKCLLIVRVQGVRLAFIDTLVYLGNR